LLTDDSALVKTVCEVIGSISDLGVATEATVKRAIARLDEPEIALVVAHLGMHREVDLVAELLRKVSAANRPLATIIISEHDQAEQALTLLRLGAAENLTRPLDLSRLGYLCDVLTLRARAACKAECQAVSETEAVACWGDEEPFLFLPSAPMGEVMEQIQRVAPQDTTLILTGETGTGKSRLARLIHGLSPRQKAPFLVVHCGTLSASLIESEIFGHVRGAFTGADQDRAGKFAAAGDGTLFLDDIDALPLELQAKLLRVVEDRVFEPVGSNRSLSLRARLIVASNRNLEQEVAAGRFRSDLYYRLNVVGFHLPPLRERREVILSLANSFLQRFAAANPCQARGFALSTLQLLHQHEWPGNIRELRNVVERAVALSCSAEIQPDDLPPSLRMFGIEKQFPAHRFTTCAESNSSRASKPTSSWAEGVAATLVQAKEKMEVIRITEALERHNYNRLRTAVELGISRMTLYKKMRRYGLQGL
jgi:DNA-binding NtrC family response regulator